jgi:hypothetical protein
MPSSSFDCAWDDIVQRQGFYLPGLELETHFSEPAFPRCQFTVMKKAERDKTRICRRDPANCGERTSAACSQGLTKPQIPSLCSPGFPVKFCARNGVRHLFSSSHALSCLLACSIKLEFAMIMSRPSLSKIACVAVIAVKTPLCPATSTVLPTTSTLRT